jgi:hypothetical protein
MAQLIESEATLSDLRRRYEDALATYSQGRQAEQEGTQQDQEATTERSTAAGYTSVLEQTLAILRSAQNYPTVTTDPDGERKRVLDESTRKLSPLLEDWHSQRLVSNEVYHQARIAMLETVLANFAELKHYDGVS